MLQLLMVALFFILPATTCAKAENPQNSLPIYNVFFDGVFDLAHWGHFNSIQKVRTKAAEHLGVEDNQIHLIVGISGPTEKDIARYKRPSVLTLDEKMQTMQFIKGVDEVRKTHLKTTKKFLNENNISLVVTGHEYYLPPYFLRHLNKRKGSLYYQEALKQEKLITIPRTEGISTTELQRRTVKTVARYIEQKQGEEDACIRHFLQLMDIYLPPPKG